MFGLNRLRANNSLYGEYITARINARIQPIDRGEFFEDPLHEVISRSGIGEVTGGGTQLADDPDGIAFCDVEMCVGEVSEAAISTIIARLEALGAPRGSRLILDPGWSEIPFGQTEGMGVFLNGIDLPDVVYLECDFETAVEKLDRALGESGSYRGFWQGEHETGLYCYGASYFRMKGAISSFLDRYPLCEGARVVQIA